MINPSAYYTVQGWMREELGLSGNALAVYAIIYGFSQDGASEYAGSARYLAEWLGCSKRTVLSVLATLTEQGHLIKKTTYQNGITFCNYVAAKNVQKEEAGPGEKISPLVKKFHGGGENISPGEVKIFHGGGEKISPHNTSHNDRYINKEINIGDADASTAPAEAGKKVKHKHGEYNNVLLTDEELDKLRGIFPHDLQERIERLSEYIASTGKTYKSHYATIRAWANRDKKQPAPAARRGQPGGMVGPNGIAIDPTKTDMAGLFE